MATAPKMAAPARKFLFELTATESADTAKKVDWATRLPTYKKTNNDSANEDLQEQRDAFVEVIDLLWRNKAYTTKTASWLKKKIEEGSKATQQLETQFAKLTTLRNLDQHWAALWVLKHCPGLQLATIKKGLSVDEDTVTQLLRCALNAVATLSLNVPALLLKDNMELVFDVVYFQGGMRLQGITDASFLEPGTNSPAWPTHAPLLDLLQGGRG